MLFLLYTADSTWAGWFYDQFENILQFEEQREQVIVERVLQVVFLDPERSTPVSLDQ